MIFMNKIMETFGVIWQVAFDTVVLNFETVKMSNVTGYNVYGNHLFKYNFDILSDY